MCVAIGIDHLAYVDDLLVFPQGLRDLGILQDYELTSASVDQTFKLGPFLLNTWVFL